MGEMTNEEAIALLQVQMNFNRTMQRGWGNTLIETDAGNIVDGALYANQHKDVADALELAINALRAGGTDTNVPTMPAGQPLTLEQLRGMDGQCVKVVVDGVEPLEMLALVEVPEDEDCVLLRNNLGGASEFYSNDDLKDACVNVYSYSPANIDREAWEPCSRCRPQENSLDRFSGHEFLIDDAEIYFYDSDDGWEGEEIKFCPWCGRPLTEGAWAELEKRVMGVKHYGT